MALSVGQKALLKRYNLEYRDAAAGKGTGLAIGGDELDIAVAALAACNARNGITPLTFPQIASHLTSHGLTPPG
jgi:hypothetical protein